MLEREWIEEQKKLDLLMEIERLKGLKMEDDRVQRRHEASLRGAQVITEQIQDRYQQRVKD